jgi:hypothetical protein
MEEYGRGLAEVTSRYLPVRTKETNKAIQLKIQYPDQNLNLAPHE